MEELIRFIDAFYKANHRTPSTREIAEHTLLKKSSAYNYLAALRAEGRIDFDGRIIITAKINDIIVKDCKIQGVVVNIIKGTQA